MVKTDKTLDIRGLVSPRPEAVARNTLESMGPGQVLTVITTDVTAKRKLPSLCENLGCTLLELREDGGTLYFQIRK